MRLSQSSDAGRLEIAGDQGANPAPLGPVSDVRLRVLGGQGLSSAGSVIVAGAFAIWLVAYLTTSLGVVAYGVWATTAAVLAPLIVLDAGLSFVVVRATAARSAGQHAAAEEVTTANSLYLVLGLACVAVGVVLGLVPAALLGLEPTAAVEARRAAWILAADFGLVIATSAYPGVLRGLRRYDVLLLASVLQVGVSAAVAVVLVPAWGLSGGATAVLAGHTVARMAQASLVRRFAPWFSLRPHRPRWTFMRRVARFTAPLIVISIAGQIGFSLDVVVVAGIAGAAAASWVSIGARLPWMALGVLQVVVDVLFPVFVHQANMSTASVPPILWRAIRAAGVIGGCAFTYLILGSGTITVQWIGETDPVGLTVLVLYSVAWAIHMPAHVLALVVVSREKHAILALVVLGESLLNLALSVPLVITMGPAGAALASLIAVATSNGIVVPLIARDRVGAPFWRTVANAWLGLGIGAAISASAWAIPTIVGLQAVEALVVQTAVTVVVGLVGLAILWQGGLRPAGDPG